MKFDLQWLQAFSTLAEHLSFTVTANLLHVTQPTLSATIRKLEESLGARLFDRDTRTVRLTYLGQEFLGLARRVLGEADNAESAMKHLILGRSGSVRLSAPAVLFPHFLQPALLEYRTRHPGIRMEVSDQSTSDATKQLRRGQVDLAIVTQVQADAELNCLPLDETTVVALLPRTHALARSRSIPWSSILQEPVARFGHRSAMGAYVDQRLFDAGLRVTVSYDVEQLTTVVGLIRAGMAVGIMSSAPARLMAADGLVMRKLSKPHIARPLVLASRAGRELSPAATLLQETILRCCTRTSAAR